LGKLSIQDEIIKFIPDYPTHGHKVTIAHLLTHTSGIRDFTSYENFREIEGNDYSPAEFIDIFKNRPMLSAPGEAYSYSNAGYFLLGAIIEKVSGKTYGQFMEDEFFKPLGMENMSFDYSQEVIENRATGYGEVSGGKMVNANKISMIIPFSAGGLLSTTEDMLIWYNSLKSGKIISLENLKKAHSPFKLNNGKFTRYGFGWDLGTLANSSLVAHGGAIAGFYSALVYLPKEDVLAVVLTNCNWQNASFFNLATRLAGVAIGKPYFQNQKSEVATDLEAYEAVYENETGEKTSILIESGNPYLISQTGRRYELFQLNESAFYCEDNFTTLNFERDKDGVISVTLTRVAPIKFKRTQAILPKKSVYLAIKGKSFTEIEEIISFYKALKSNQFAKYNFSGQNELNRFGYDLLSTRKKLSKYSGFWFLNFQQKRIRMIVWEKLISRIIS
jgi:CubicO group peptidase (beta-lactamase class C family)